MYVCFGPGSCLIKIAISYDITKNELMIRKKKNIYISAAMVDTFSSTNKTKLIDGDLHITSYYVFSNYLSA